MARRHGRRTAAHDSPLADLDLVLADDACIDQIGTSPWPARPFAVTRPGAHRASGRHHRAANRHHRAASRHRADHREPLVDLFEQWRVELAERPLPAMDIPPVRSLRPTRPMRRVRPVRSLLAVVAAIGALVVGSATIAAADAEPGSALWPIAKVLWPARTQSAESARAVQVALDEARAALDSGRSRDAQAAIIRAFGELPNVEAGDARESMQNAVVALWAESVPPRPNGPGSETSPPPDRPVPPVSPFAPPDSGGVTPGEGRAEPATPAAIEAVAVRPPATVDPAAHAVDPASAASVTSPPAGPVVVTAASSSPAPPTSATASAIAAESVPSMPSATPTPPSVPAQPTAQTPTPTTSAAPSTTQQSAPSPTAISEEGGTAPTAERAVPAAQPAAQPAEERDPASSDSAADTSSTS